MREAAPTRIVKQDDTRSYDGTLDTFELLGLMSVLLKVEAVPR